MVKTRIFKILDNCSIRLMPANIYMLCKNSSKNFGYKVEKIECGKNI